MVKKDSWFLYLLECEDGSVYTGIAKDVHDRFARHRAGKGARYTRARKPLRILGYMECPNYSAALKLEYAVKQLAPVEKWSLALSLPKGEAGS